MTALAPALIAFWTFTMQSHWPRWKPVANVVPGTSENTGAVRSPLKVYVNSWKRGL
jgi:hypothetical protein